MPQHTPREKAKNRANKKAGHKKGTCNVPGVAKAKAGRKR